MENSGGARLVRSARARWAAAAAIPVVTAIAGAVFAWSRPDEWTSRATLRISASPDAGRLRPGEGREILRQRVRGFFAARHVLRPFIEEEELYQQLAAQGYDSGRLFGHLRAHSSYEVPSDDTILLTYSHRDPAVAQAMCQRLAEFYCDPPTGGRNQTYRVAIVAPADRPSSPEGPQRARMVLTFAGAGLASSLGLVLLLLFFGRGRRPLPSVRDDPSQTPRHLQ